MVLNTYVLNKKKVYGKVMELLKYQYLTKFLLEKRLMISFKKLCFFTI